MKNKNLEQSILHIKQISQEGSVKVGDLLEIFHGRGSLLLIMLLTIPFCLPIQVPGLSTPFGLAIFFISLRTAFRSKIWLTRSLMNHEIKPRHLEMVFDWGLWLAKKLKPIMHSRLSWICQRKYLFRFHCIVIAILALILALPLPVPFHHFFSAWPILLISLGLVEDDGLFVLLGYGMAASGIFFFEHIYSFITRSLKAYNEK